MKQSSKLAFTGLICALSLVIMFLGGIIPSATIALPALAGCILIPIVAELGVKWGITAFLAVSVLSFFIVTDKEALLIYVLFFGYYPAIYGMFDKIKSSIVKMVLKLILFNAAAIGEFYLTIYVLFIPFETIEGLGVFAPFAPIILLLLANVVFIIYDKALKGLIIMYFQKFHKQALKILK
ncbi:MAG: hypothetical protein E7564_05570 [Ruminococcaceae bacterium]|nr:hypothetical protein [Oscillospiraceae bacterium]